MLWKKHIDQEIIDLFLEEIFKKVGRSFFDMENIMKNYIWGDCSFFCNKSEFEEDYCSKCEYVVDNKILEERLEEKQDKIDIFKNKMELMEYKMELMELNHNNEIEKMKKDCIVFKI